MRTISTILSLSMVLVSCCYLQDKRVSEELNDTAAMLIATYGDNVDSLQKAERLLSQAIDMAPKNSFLYGQKAQVLCQLGQFDDALAVLEDCEKRVGNSTEGNLFMAMLLDYKGDSVAATPLYDSVIVSYRTQLTKLPEDTPQYDALVINYIFALQLRHGNSAAKEQIDYLKSSNDYPEMVKMFENFDKESYLRRMICCDDIDKLKQNDDLDLTATAQQTTIRSATRDKPEIRENKYSYTTSTVPIEDLHLLAYLLKEYDINSDGRLSTAEAKAISSIECDNMGIEHLPDLAHFPNLKLLRCPKNKITHIGGANNPYLVKIVAYDNPLASIDLDGCPSIYTLALSSCQLESIDLSPCPKLEWLCLNDNRLTALDLSPCAELLDLQCSDNKIATLDLRPCPLLTSLLCNKSGMTSLLLGDHPDLKSIRCYGNDLVEINLRGCPELSCLVIINNKLQLLDVTQNPLLKELDCCENNLTHIDLSAQSVLTSIQCYDNAIDSIDLSACPLLNTFSVGTNPIETLDLSGNPLLRDLDCRITRLRTLDLTANPDLKRLVCEKGCLEKIIVTQGHTFDKFFKDPQTLLIYK